MNTTRLEARTMTENDLNNAVNAMPFLAPKTAGLYCESLCKIQQCLDTRKKKFQEFLEKRPTRRGRFCTIRRKAERCGQTLAGQMGGEE
jgi:hypothetical protein